MPAKKATVNTGNARRPSFMEDGVRFVAPGSPEHEAMLSGGYGGMTREKAETIIRERKENPATHPYDRMELAEAFLAALGAKPVVIATNDGWRRDRQTIR
jgi:hypothetical protein